MALVLGLLLVVCTSGVPLLWHEEIVRAQHPEAYRAAGPATMSFDEVAAVVERHDRSFRPQSMYHTHGVIVADDFESGRRVSVDPSNGRVLADFNPVTEGGFVTTTMGLMYNLHLCLLSCEEYPGYQQQLAAQVPGSAYMHFDYAGDLLVSVDRHDPAKAQVTYGGPGVPLAQELWEDFNFPAHSGMLVNGWWRVVWGVLGLVPLLLAVTGLSTWFWTRGVRKRRRRRAAEAAAGPRGA